MNVLAAVCIAPCGIGDEFAPMSRRSSRLFGNQD